MTRQNVTAKFVAIRRQYYVVDEFSVLEKILNILSHFSQTKLTWIATRTNKTLRNNLKSILRAEKKKQENRDTNMNVLAFLRCFLR